MLGRLALILSVLLLPACADAQPYKAPRTASGAPDLQGTWDTDSMTRFQRPKRFAGLIKIVQTPEHVVLFGEQNNEARIVRLASRRHLHPAIRPWMGDPVGWWEGDTLVVETTNLNPNDRWRWNSGDWIMLTAGARITERFTRTGPAEILYSYAVEDPGAYTQTWRGERPLRATQAQIFEYACHEGNYALRNILAGGRQQEREGATKPATS